MKCIALFGAGKSSSTLIDYLKVNALACNWQVFVADKDVKTATQKTGDHAAVKPAQVDVYNDEQRAALIQKADVVISLLPPTYHILVAKDCLRYKKHLLTASYADEEIQGLADEIKAQGLLFLYEMGLDPGIDHMSAMKLIHEIKNKGGIITSFKSHCGGLVAPESDDNPWHYKISWNPKNIVMAGKAGATYRQNGQPVIVPYEQLFDDKNLVSVPTLGTYAWYANRDSLSYARLYELDNAHTFMRTTLRHPAFCFGWKNIIDLKLTEEGIFYDTNNLSVAEFFNEYLGKQVHAKGVVQEMMNAETEPTKSEDELRLNRERTDIALQQLCFIGLRDEDTVINKGICSVADILQFLLEKKLALQPTDKDMVVMLHEIGYQLHGQTEKKHSYLIVKGEDSVHTAMAKTVGLPLGIAAKLLLEEKLVETGLHIPVSPSIYEPVLHELAGHGLQFTEL